MNQQGVLICEICNAELPNFNSMRWHIQGKRHKNALEFWKTRQEQAKTSVFVRGFPIGTSEQELWQYFAQFGRVTKVSLVKPKNLFSIIEFASADTVNYVLQTGNHKLNSQLLIVKPREVEVPGRPATNKHEQGYQQFSKGGNLGQAPMHNQGGQGGRGGARGGGRGGGGMGLLAFGRSGYKEASAPMSGPSQNETWFEDPYGQQDPGPGGAAKKKKVNVDEQIEMYYHEELIEKLVRVKGVQNQLEWLCQNLQVTAEEAQTKFTLCEKLQNTLGQFFPGCTVNQFGSSVNGFGLTGCDMDIFLDLSTMHSRTWEVTPIKLPFVRDFKFLKEKEWGPLLPKDLERMGMTDQCKLICRILTDNLEGILDAQIIPSQRCPIVRFKYAGSDVKCDLSVNNKMALQNTKLLYLFSVLNSRVRLLVYAIRYWGKVKGIAGNNQASTKLSNYALTLMVLNYLQNLDPPVLPTIEKLSQLHGPTGRSKIEAWDVTFAMDWQIIPQSNNTQTAAELLSGFFSYWSAFNFNDNVLVSRTGTELPFTQFFEKDNMPDGRIRSFKASAINIQDPFVLMHNITQNVNDKMRETIVRELRIAAIKTSVWGNEGFSLTNPSGGGDLVHLLNNEVPDIIKAEDQEKDEEVHVKGRMPNRHCTDFSFEVPLKPTQLNSQLLKRLQKGEGDFKVEWCKRMCVFMTRIMKEVLLLTVEDLPEATEEVLAKLAEEKRKAEAADKRNSDIRARRRARRMEKRSKLEEEHNARMAALKESMNKEETDEGIEEGGATEKDAMETETEGQEGVEGEAAEGEKTDKKRARPVNIFDIDMQVPKKFKGIKSMEFDLDSYISDSDDGEEIIEYKAEVPELKYKEPERAEIDIQNFMRAWCMTWARRKKVKNYLVNECGRQEEGTSIAMEKLISETIYQNDGAPLRRPVVGFYCRMESSIQGNETKVIVTMDCKEGGRDWNTFYQFNKMYLYKMIEKYFN